MKHAFPRLMAIVPSALWFFVSNGSGFELPDDGGRYVRAYFTDVQSAHDALQRFEAQGMEISYENRYMIFKMTPGDIAWLAARGWKVVEEPGYDIALRRVAAQPPEDGKIPGYPSYCTVERTFAVAESLAAALPSLATCIDIGDSWEKTKGLGGYDLKVLRLTNAHVPGPKPRLCITGSIHAREYATAELVLRFVLHLVNNYGKDADVTWLLDHHEYHAYFFVNPDGRKHAEKGEMWRKNTNTDYCKPTPSERGVDLNRNIDYKWSTFGSNDQCSEVYYGPRAASEPEIQTLQAYLDTLYSDSAKTGVYIDLHSYGQVIYRPGAVTTLTKKISFFNKYGNPVQRGGQAYEYPFYKYGTASFLIELGNGFFEKCDFFETNIVSRHIPAFIYAMKACRDPLAIALGPDAIDLSISGSTLTATIDDTRYGQTVTTHAITAAEYYAGIPPWLPGANAISMAAADGGFNSTVEKVRAPLVLADRAAGEKVTIFVRGRDAGGNWGAVSGIFHEIASATGKPEQAEPFGELFVDCPRMLSGDATIRIYLPRASALRLSLFDLKGREALRLLDGSAMPPGRHTVRTPARLPAEGVYALRIGGAAGRHGERLVLVR